MADKVRRTDETWGTTAQDLRGVFDRALEPTLVETFERKLFFATILLGELIRKCSDD